MSSVICAPARAQDGPAIKKFLDESLSFKFSETFFSEIFSSTPTSRYKVFLAVHEKRLVGAIAVKISPLSFLRESGELKFELLEGGSAEDVGSTVACIVALAVSPSHRHMGIGTQLLEDALVGALQSEPGEPMLKVAYVFCHNELEGFFDQAFTCLGELPGHYSLVKDSAKDNEEQPNDKESIKDNKALVFARAMWPDVNLAYYKPQVSGKLPDLSDPALKHTRPMAPWLRTLLFYYVLPISFVAILFLICHTLVVLGPLKGISGVIHPDPVPLPSLASWGPGESTEL